MNHFEIKRISIRDLDPKTFLTEYFLKDVPVVITDVGADWPIHKRRTPETVLQQLQQSESVTYVYAWYNATKEFLSDDYKTPDFVEHCLDSRYSSIREQFMRFWVHQKGNITQWHYDGNGLFVFNLHLNGKKKWTIVSPQTPLKSYPFIFWSMPFDIAPPDEDTVYSSFVLGAGDLLYVPPFWQHRVESLAEWNLNLNWVGTKKDLSSVPSKTLERELNILKLANSTRLSYKVMNKVNGGKEHVGGDFKKYIAGYGGNGSDFLKSSKSISTARMLKFGFSEMSLAQKIRKMPTPWRFEANDLPNPEFEKA